jgi:RNA polymerase sigma-70 factor (ECF subfamily)
MRTSHDRSMTTGRSGGDCRDLAVALDRARVGDEYGFSVLFRAFHPRLLRYLRAREPARADDIAAETWLAVAAQIRTFDGDQVSFAAWLFTIARNRLADARRTAARRHTEPLANLPEQLDLNEVEEAALERLDAQAAVDLVVRQLTPDQADVVLLRTLAGLGVNEIATMLGRDAVWVRVTHHRAMKRLQERVTQ